MTGRDHSFSRNAEFWAKPWNLPISMEFLCFRRIEYKRYNRAYCCQVQAAIKNENYYIWTRFRFEIHNCHSVSNGRNIQKILNWAHLKYCQFIWQTCICQLWLPATNTACLVGFREPYKITYYTRKAATVSCRIWETGPQNLEKFTTENCGP